MRTQVVHVSRFDGGMADDIYGAGPGEFSISKHFDILSYPNRLSPLRGMAADTTNTKIGNMVVGSDGNFYGLGVNYPTSSTLDALWVRGASSWTVFGTNAAETPVNNLLVEYHKSNGVRQLFYGTTSNHIISVDLADANLVSKNLTFTNIAQGFVHPKDDILYVPFDNGIALNNNGSWTGTSIANAALILPANYRLTGATHYGDYLAIPACPSVGGVDGGGGGNNSKVFLWDRNTSNTTVSEVIDWGTGNLKVLNNLGGVLIGISDQGGASSTILDRDSIVIRAYAGGEPVVIKEISTLKQTSTVPDASINPNVNFIYRNRLYFSIDISSGSTSPVYHGLFSIGKSRLTRKYSVTMERMATVGNTEIAVLAAAISGDKTAMVYDAVGTLSFTNSTASTSAQYTATSVYESAVNPEMPDADKPLKKKLVSVAVHTLPLVGGQVVMKTRVDGGSFGSALLTKTATSPDTNLTVYETPITAAMAVADGRNFEFRLESTLGAEIVGYTYKYQIMETQLI